MGKNKGGRPIVSKGVPRVRLNPEEYQLINQFRAIKNESNELGLNDEDVKHGWLKSKNASLFFKNPNFKQAEEVNYKELQEAILKDIRDFKPEYPTIFRNPSTDGHLLVIDPADIHIGKLCEAFETGEDYNNQIAVKRVKDGVQGILDKSSGFNIDKILFIGGNDILHIDTPKRQTTSGTPQDTDGMWYSNFLIAKKLYVDILETLLAVADVHFTFNPSNHDYTHGFFLADVIQTWFKDCNNISFDCSIAHRKGFLYGKNLIGTTHGDGAKHGDLPLLMATEFSHEWSLSKHRYVYTHHVHHKTSKDYIGVTVESLRSPSGTDSWHHRNGYQHSPKAVEGFIHHKEFGQVCKFHIYFNIFASFIVGFNERGLAVESVSPFFMSLPLLSYKNVTFLPLFCHKHLPLFRFIGICIRDQKYILINISGHITTKYILKCSL